MAAAEIAAAMAAATTIITFLVHSLCNPNPDFPQQKPILTMTMPCVAAAPPPP